jgi:hypothetical protein
MTSPKNTDIEKEIKIIDQKIAALENSNMGT